MEPRVLEGLVGCETLARVHQKAVLYEILGCMNTRHGCVSAFQNGRRPQSADTFGGDIGPVRIGELRRGVVSVRPTLE